MNSIYLNQLKNLTNLSEVSEIEATYYVVLIGKFLELNGLKKKYPATIFMRNWIVHSELSYEQLYLSELRENIESVHLGKEILSPKLIEFVRFLRFKKEMQSFYGEHLNTKLNDQLLFILHKSILKIIQEVPIKLKTRTGNLVIYFSKDELFIKGGGFNGSIQILE